MDTVTALRKYNRWRRGLDAWHEDAGPNPKDIGEQIDAAADEIESLRAENEKLRAILDGDGYVRCPACGGYDTGYVPDDNGDAAADYCKACDHRW